MIKRSKLSAALALALTASMLLGACGGGTANNSESQKDSQKESQSSGTEYIAAPYTIDDEKQGPTEYLEPVFYENENGPTIGVTLVGVIKQDGKYFKDSDNDQELDDFEDWRLDTDTRVADLLTKLNTQQRAGLLENQLVCSPSVKTAEEAYTSDGKVDLTKLMVVTEDALNAWQEKTESVTFGQAGGAGGVTSQKSERANSTGEMLTYESRTGVLRATTDGEVGALWTNSVNMVAEYAAVAKDEPTIPFIILSNPQEVINVPDNMGLAAAVMGDNENYSLIKKYADYDRQIWDAKGISRMYGPQIDLITDPRWNRNNGTYTEVPEVMAGIADALVQGYQTGTDGVQDGDVALIMKHFPGDGASNNGFESHYEIGQWRVYATEGSLEKYQLVGFQAAIDAGVAGIMPGYSRQAADGTYGSVTQTYKGLTISSDDIANAYSETILEKLLRDTMGFTGFINTDSGVVTGGMDFGTSEDMTDTEKKAAVINAGSDIIGDSFAGVNWEDYTDAINQGLITAEALDRANGNMLKSAMDQGQFENPYKDVDESKTTVEKIVKETESLSKELHQKSVVLMKNHENVLPLKDTSKKVYIASFTQKGEDEDTIKEWTEAFEGAGFTVVSKAADADIAFLSVVPGGVSNSNKFMNVIDLVEDLDVPQVDYPNSTEKTGETESVTTLMGVKDIQKIADTVHGNGGTVIASINITSPWILTNLEPYCDGLIGSFGTTVEAQMDVLKGDYNPTGKLPITMVSCNEVIAVKDTVIDGVTYEICVSPNDVPGYDKDQYIDADVLAQSPSGSYAYKDADGNVYTSWFGLSY